MNRQEFIARLIKLRRTLEEAITHVSKSEFGGAQSKLEQVEEDIEVIKKELKSKNAKSTT